MQFFTVAAFIGSAMAIANPLLEVRATKSLCSTVDSCVMTAGQPAMATSFCASYNAVPTTTATVCGMNSPGVDVLAPQKPRCLKTYLDGRLSKACSCIIGSTYTATETMTTSC